MHYNNDEANSSSNLQNIQNSNQNSNTDELQENKQQQQLNQENQQNSSKQLIIPNEKQGNATGTITCDKNNTDIKPNTKQSSDIGEYFANLFSLNMFISTENIHLQFRIVERM